MPGRKHLKKEVEEYDKIDLEKENIFFVLR